MYIKIMGFLEAWKENEHRKPLILQGARQVGKTYSILEFGRIHYENGKVLSTEKSCYNLIVGADIGRRPVFLF